MRMELLEMKPEDEIDYGFSNLLDSIFGIEVSIKEDNPSTEVILGWVNDLAKKTEQLRKDFNQLIKKEGVKK